MRDRNHVPLISTIALALGLSVPGAALFSSEAEARPSTRSYTCGGLRDFIASNGPVTMDTTSNRVYRQFVTRRTQCQSYENLRRISVPTRDGQCRVAICAEPLSRSSGQ